MSESMNEEEFVDKCEMLTVPLFGSIPINKNFSIEDTIITDNSNKSEYDEEAAGYSKAVGKKYRDVVNTIQFLNRCDVEGSILVIIVTNWVIEDTDIISKLFPKLKRIDVWTPLGSYRRCNIDKVRVRPMFPNTLSYEENDKLLLVCGIYDVITEEQELQLRMVDHLRPLSSSLKFRPMFPKNLTNETVEFFDGEYRTVCFGGPASLELRVYVDSKDGFKKSERSLKDHESKMFYYNVTLRNEYFNGVRFDIAYCNYILNEYKEKFGTNKHIERLVSEISCLRIAYTT